MRVSRSDWRWMRLGSRTRSTSGTERRTETCNTSSARCLATSVLDMPGNAMYIRTGASSCDCDNVYSCLYFNQIYLFSYGEDQLALSVTSELDLLQRFPSFFAKEHSDSKSKYFEDDIIKMLEFLEDTICVVYAGKVFQKIVGIPIGTNCAPLLADIWNRIYTLNPKETVGISVRFHPDDNRWCLVHKQPIVWELHGPYVSCWPWNNDTTESNTSASYLDLLLPIGRGGQLNTSMYDKRDDFNFHITNIPFLSRIFHLRPSMAYLSRN